MEGSELHDDSLICSLTNADNFAWLLLCGACLGSTNASCVINSLLLKIGGLILRADTSALPHCISFFVGTKPKHLFTLIVGL